MLRFVEQIWPPAATANTPIDSAIIWLHGLGADGHDFHPIVAELNLDKAHRIRFIFPHAPTRPITINGGMVMPAWFDIGPGFQIDEPGLMASVSSVNELIQSQLDQGVSRIILAGFSQGGAVALQTLLTNQYEIAGVLALSTFLPDSASHQPNANAGHSHCPILFCHGNQDPMVPIAIGEQAYQQMKRLGYRVSWQDYPMQHQVCPAEIADISQWLDQVLSKPQASQ